MKLLRIIMLLAAGLSIRATRLYAQISTKDLPGAWETGTGIKKTMIVTNKYFSVAVYEDKQFISTAGGSWKLNGNDLIQKFEFNTADPQMVGVEAVTPISLKNGKLDMAIEGKTETWNQVDNGTPGKLAGAWLITGRMTGGQMHKMTPSARRTMKILSGTRFQWIAYNTETKEFFGTGGGKYTTENGKYTENILFFSRDNTRVSASLQFDFSIEDGNWHHKGLSSKGDPIDEVWTRREKTGL